MVTLQKFRFQGTGYQATYRAQPYGSTEAAQAAADAEAREPLAWTDTGEGDAQGSRPNGGDEPDELWEVLRA